MLKANQLFDCVSPTATPEAGHGPQSGYTLSTYTEVFTSNFKDHRADFKSY